MTLDEKLAQIGCVWSSQLLLPGADAPLGPGGGLNEAAAREKLAHGIGHITRIGAATVLRPAESAAFANAIQRFLVDQTRLGVPAVIHEESCAGYVGRDATCFPQALGLAATFEPALVQRMGEAIRAQMLAVGARHTLAPVLDVARDPRWGRTEETFGEDPYLTAAMGVAYVRGVQDARGKAGEVPGVLCTGKHFLGYAMSEGGLNWAPVHVGARELRDVYAFPFEAAIREAGLASMMNSYSELDGVPCGASRAVLTDLLRGELGFDGVVVADYFTVDTLRSYHRIACDKAEAARRALEAGLDVELPQLDCFGPPLREAVQKGLVEIARVDEAVRRLLVSKLRLGIFERPYVDAGRAPEVFDTKPQRALARELARKSIVLLKNEGGLLPLAKDLGRIAVIGPSADSIRLLQGDYHYPTHLEIVFGTIEEGGVASAPAAAALAPAPSPNPGASPRTSRRSGVDLAECFPPMVSVLAGLRAAVSPRTDVVYARGCDVLDPDPAGFAEAVAAARGADVAILVVGGRSGLVAGCTSGEATDRCELGLPGVQQLLVEAVVATGTPVVVVLIDGRPLAVPWIAEHARALLHAWLPGEEGGSAVADVLFGDASPGGRLPISVPRSTGQLPVFYGHKPSGGRSQWKGTYADGPTTPLYPFGHGLAYTRFEYADLTIHPADAGLGDLVTISARVTNVGARAGDEVVQLYTYDRVASVTRPVKELRGFARVALAPGEQRRVTFELAVEQLAFTGLEGRLVIEPGEVDVMVGASSDDIRLTGRLELVGPEAKLKQRTRFTTPVRVEPAR